MRFLQALVGIQAVVLVVLLVLWAQRADGMAAPAAPFPAASGDAPSPPAAAPAATVASLDPPLAPERFVASGGDGGGIVLHGRLLGLAAGTDRGSIQVVAQSDAGRTLRAAVKGDRYAIAGLTPSAWRVSCRAHRHRPLTVDCTVTSAPLQRLDLTLEPLLVLPVKVRTPSGEPLRTALVRLQAVVPQVWRAVATAAPIATDLPPIAHGVYADFGQGRHRQDGDLDPSERVHPDGVLDLHAPPPAHATLLMRHLVIARQRIEPGQTELVFVVDPADVLAALASVRMRAVDAAGQVLPAHAEAEVMHLRRPAQPAYGGALRITHLVPGPTTVMLAAAPPHEALRICASLARGQQLDLGDVILGTGSRLQGRLVDAADPDATIPPSHVTWSNLGAWRPPQPLPVEHGSSTAGGGVSLPNAGAHRYLVHGFTEDGRLGVVLVDGGALRAEPFTVPLRMATMVRFRSTLDDQRGCTLVVRAPEGHPVYVVAFTGLGREQGRPLVPGDYRLEVFDGFGAPQGSRALTVGATPLQVEVP